jgi:DNA polymerase-1
MAKKTAKNKPEIKPLDKAQGKRKRLLVLDSHAILHRAYHAIPDLSSSKGEPTGALFGLSTMLLKSITELKPDYIVAARDREGKTHRHELFEEYKGTRAKTDDALITQLKRTSEIFDAFGIPTLDLAGYEADDIIGTIAKQTKKEKNLQIIILTGDMDILQLIDDGRVEVFRLLTGINDLKLFDEQAVLERYGFGPERVTDYKGIRGDPSDNIPGVPGVGEGSATKLIQTFGDIDEIYKAIKKMGVEPAAKKAGIQKRYAQLVADNEKSARFSKQLATIHCDVPIQFKLPAKEWDLDDNRQSVIEMCEKLEFRTLKERLQRYVEKKNDSPEAQEREQPERAPEQEVDEKELAETSVALWLLHSDLTAPSFEIILEYGNSKDFSKARAAIFAELKKTGRLQELFDTIERPLIAVVERMNSNGVGIDVAQLKSLAKEYSKELGNIAGRIFRHAGREFNISSPKQLAVVLFDELKILPAKQKMTATGARTTKESELEKLSEMHPIIAEVLAYRELQKLLSTYIEKIPALVDKDGRLRAEFLQAGTTTGRMGSKDPNLQNIPIKSEYGRRIREAFTAGKGRVMASLDYSQIELRIAAGLSGDKKLVEVFTEGGDVHTAVASQVFGVPPEKVDYEMRRRAKVINFGILYGMGVNALRANLGASVSREEAATFLDQYFKNFSGLRRYLDETKAFAAKHGYTETIFGRRRYFSGFKSSLPGLRAQAERMAINAPMQGTQSDIIKLAMVEADQLIEKNGWRGKAELVLQVHDELVYELDEKIAEDAARKIRDVMERVAPADKLSGVPIIAEIAMGKTWGSMQKVSRI